MPLNQYKPNNKAFSSVLENNSYSMQNGSFLFCSTTVTFPYNLYACVAIVRYKKICTLVLLYVYMNSKTYSAQTLL